MPASKPNIVILTAHDLGNHLGCYGAGKVRTPHIDQLAGEGTRFSHFFATAPICSPARMSFLTGLYPPRHGVMGIAGGQFQWAPRQGVQHLSHYLRDAGYRTKLFGIQHEAPTLHALAFDDTIPLGGRSAKDLAVDFATFLDTREDEQPFYAQIGFFETHTPYDRGGCEPAPLDEVYVPPYVIDDQDARRHIAGMQGALRRVDDAVGKVMAALKAHQIQGRTILIFTADHGPELPRAKWFLYDPGVAVPLIMRWPNEIAAGQVDDALLSGVDFLPTLLELIDEPVPAHLGGRSFASNVRGSYGEGRDAVYLFQHGFELRAVRTSSHKLICNFERHPVFSFPAALSSPYQPGVPCPPLELYDLQADPCESRNLLEGEPSSDIVAIRGNLLARLRTWLEQTGDPILQMPTMPTPHWRSAVGQVTTGSHQDGSHQHPGQ